MEEQGKSGLYKIVTEHTSTFSVEERLNACLHFISSGNLRATSRELGINYDTLCYWKTKDWWGVAVNEYRRRKQDELDSKFTNIIHDVMGQIEDRLENGDVKYDSKVGVKVRIPVTARDLAHIATTLFDKRAAIRGDPVSHSSTGKDDNIKKLEDKFSQFANILKNSGVLATPIEGEVIANEQENKEGSESDSYTPLPNSPACRE